jgi:hypothetical protein
MDKNWGQRQLKPFLARLGHKARRQMASVRFGCVLADVGYRHYRQLKTSAH